MKVAKNLRKSVKESVETTLTICRVRSLRFKADPNKQVVSYYERCKKLADDMDGNSEDSRRSIKNNLEVIVGSNENDAETRMAKYMQNWFIQQGMSPADFIVKVYCQVLTPGKVYWHDFNDGATQLELASYK